MHCHKIKDEIAVTHINLCFSSTDNINFRYQTCRNLCLHIFLRGTQIIRLGIHNQHREIMVIKLSWRTASVWGHPSSPVHSLNYFEFMVMHDA